MALKFKVKGLGKIEDGEFNINPLTVITGPNGTGKSFFTKMIYSIFRMIEDISLSEEVNYLLNDIIDTYQKQNKIREDEKINKNDEIESLIPLIKEIKSIALDFNYNNQDDCLIKISKLIKDTIKIDITESPESWGGFINKEFSTSDEENMPYSKVINSSSSRLNLGIIYMFMILNPNSSKVAYEHLLQKSLGNEIKDNFQIADINEIKNDEISIVSDELFNIVINNDVITQINNIDFFKNRPTSVFFESPAYWRVRDALVEAKMKSGTEYLSGVPKYFFDLDSALRKKSKVESELLSVYENIKDELSGEFIFEGGNISFNDHLSDTKISKNLVSFGTTNLGMLNALIKNNVIKKGSYVFIDEPETNLHPDWQVLMIKSLTTLAEMGVNVIITTHSTDILKYIEVYFDKYTKSEEGKEQLKELLSINYIDTDGTTLEFDSECPHDQVKEALLELSSPFFNLYMEK